MVPRPLANLANGKFPMNVGICLLLTDYSFDVLEFARRVESLGFESLWAPEHGVIPVDFKTEVPQSREKGVPIIYQQGHINQLLHPFAWLGAVAAATSRIGLGTGICLVPQHNLLDLAKQVATVDRLSGGRLLFGIGAGWLRGESEAFGVDFPNRWSQTRETIQAMKVLWRDDIAEFHGDYVDFPPLICRPKPVQEPHPPILIAGELKGALERIVEYGDGWIPRVRHTSPYRDPHLLAQARQRLEQRFMDAGRDPAALTVTAWDAEPERESNRRFFDAGADRVVHLVITGEEASTLSRLDEIASEVL